MCGEEPDARESAHSPTANENADGVQVELGRGAYADEGAATSAQIHARNLFLAAIERDASPVLESLRQEPLDHFGALCHVVADVWGEYDYSTMSNDPPRWPWRWRPLDGRPYNPALINTLAVHDVAGPWGWDRLEVWGRLRPGLRPFRDALLAWGMRWRLDQEWCLRFAFRQVDAWYRWPSARWRYDDPPVPAILTGEERQFRFIVPGWDLTAERWQDAEARLDAAYAEAKREHRRRLTALAETLELQHEPTKATPEHYSWLARYHLRGESYGRIAAGHHDRKSVEDAVKRAAALIGLDLRPPSAPGRPRGSKSVSYRRYSRK